MTSVRCSLGGCENWTLRFPAHRNFRQTRTGIHSDNVMVSIAMTNRRGLKEARRVSKILRQAAQSAEAESLRGGYHEACE